MKKTFPVFDTCLRVEPLFPVSMLMSYLIFPKSVVKKFFNNLINIPK